MSKPAKRQKEAREATRREAQRRKREKRDAKRVGGVLPREEGVRDPHVRILVVCEGAKTEPLYFQSFRIRAGHVVDVHGEGMNTESLVRKAVALRDEDGDFDEVWVVMDRDDHPRERWTRAFALASRESIHLAWTHEAFELWYLLHFDYCDAALSRGQYGDRLEGYLGRRYAKNDPHMYDDLEHLREDATRNAHQLVDHHAALGTPAADANPCTHVHRLVARLAELSH